MSLDPITAWGDFADDVAKIIGKFVPDPATAAAAVKEINDTVTARRKAQSDIVEAEVKSGSVFGQWHGALGWLMVLTYGWHIVGQQVFVAVALSFNPNFPVDKLPKIDFAETTKLLFTMLGGG